MTFTLTDAEGNPHWCEAIGKPVCADGHFTLGVVIIRDITERSLRILQEEFAALAGHELRTPLTAIVGHLMILTRSLQSRPDSERPLHNATVALSQAKRLTSLIDDLVDVSRLQTGKFRLQLAPVELDKLLQQTIEVVQVLAQDQTIVFTIENDNDDRPFVINGDAERLQQMVLNLLTNAVTHASGSIRIDVRLRRMGNMAQIEVQDYGKGIAAEHLSRLFSRFYQVIQNTPFPGQGLGLGLFISQQIVAGHNGMIAVSSTPGEGTIFTVQLPLLEQEEPI